MAEGGLRSMHVPEWDCTIYFKTVSPHEAGLAKSAVEDDDPISYYHVQLVCLKALDESGARIFKNADALAMREWACLDVFVRIAGEMSKSVSIEDAEGNSKENRSSAPGSR